MNDFFCIPVLFDYNDGYTVYQNELLNSLAFLEVFHPLPLVDAERFEQIKDETKKLCFEIYNNRTIGLVYFQVLFNKWLRLFNDAHSYVMLDDNELYPYTLRYYNGDFYFYSISSLYPNCTGKPINSINGISIKEIINNLMRIVPSENIIKACITGSYFMNSHSFLSSLGIPFDGGLLFSFSDGSELCIRKQSCTSLSENHILQIKSHYITRKLSYPFWYKIVEDKCYFQFNEMYDRFSYMQICHLMGNTPNIELIRSLPLFTEFLEEMLSNIHRNNVHKLIIDLRYNGGGNSLLGDLLLNFLGIDMGGIRKYSSYIRYSDFLMSCYPGFIRLKCSYAKPERLIEQCDVIRSVNEIPDIKLKYDGDVYFIQGQNSFSSANYLLTTIKDNALFPIIGTPTSQKPTCYGNVLPVIWPFSKTKGYVSFGYFERPNKNNTETTLFPDVLLQNSLDEYLNGIDLCWDWILKH
ncbi:S41 family peptidase [Bacteroides ndongoniae]|uniref:S41 family peptidase n=1 Tax=Bacteroides ndongoniae TaxID=1903262 RepID=UPI0008D9B7D2|nr:S41 family peptidase [Bacteroides ndongoniae]